MLKPAETTPLTALLFAEVCQQADLPAGRRQHRHRRRRAPARRSSTTRHRQDRLHRLDRGRQDDRPLDRRHRARRPPSSSAARRRTSSSTTPRSTRPSRASSTASSSTRATSAAPGRGCWCRRTSPTRSIAGSSAGSQTLRVGDPLDKNTDVGAINSREQLDRITELVDGRRGRGRRALDPGLRRCRPTGFWFRPDRVHRRQPDPPHRPGGDLRAGLSVLTFRTPQEAVAKANNTPYGLSAGVWTEKGSRILWMADQLRAGVVWANTFNKFDPTSPVRRLQGVGLRPRGRPPRARGLRHDGSVQ